MTKFARLDRLPPYVFATVNQIKMDARRLGGSEKSSNHENTKPEKHEII